MSKVLTKIQEINRDGKINFLIGGEPLLGIKALHYSKYQ